MLKQCSISQHGQKRTPYFSWPRKHISAPFSWQKCQLPEDQKDQCRNTGLYQRCKSLKAFFLLLRLHNTLKGAKYRHKSQKRALYLFYKHKSRSGQLFWAAKQVERSFISLSIYFQRLSLRKWFTQSLCQSLPIIRWKWNGANYYKNLNEENSTAKTAVLSTQWMAQSGLYPQKQG